MDIDFSKMNVGDKIELPRGKWGDALRKYYEQANEYARENPGIQFQVDGNEGSMSAPGQYWITRIK